MPENTGGQNKQMEEMVAAGIAARDANREKIERQLAELKKRKVELAAKKEEKNSWWSFGKTPTMTTEERLKALEKDIARLEDQLK